MMKLSVIIGISHLVVANTMTAVVNRGSSYALAPLGWAAIMLGAPGIMAGHDRHPSEVFEVTIGPGLMIMERSGIYVHQHPSVKSAKDLFLRMLDGLKAVYNITSAFGDVLSYMRLFALGLSGASLL